MKPIKMLEEDSLSSSFTLVKTNGQWARSEGIKHEALADDIIEAMGAQDCIEQLNTKDQVMDHMSYTVECKSGYNQKQGKYINDPVFNPPTVKNTLSLSEYVDLAKKFGKIVFPFNSRYHWHNLQGSRSITQVLDAENCDFSENSPLSAATKYWIVNDEIVLDKECNELIHDPKIVKKAKGYCKGRKNKIKETDSQVSSELTSIFTVVHEALDTPNIQLAYGITLSSYCRSYETYSFDNLFAAIKYLKYVRRFNKIKAKLKTAIKVLLKTKNKQFANSMKEAIIGKASREVIHPRTYSRFMSNIYNMIRLCRELGLEVDSTYYAKAIATIKNKRRNHNGYH